MADNESINTLKPALPDFANMRTPTEKRAAQTAPEDFRKIHAPKGKYLDSFTSEGGIGFGTEGAANARHDAEYYQKWREEKAAQVAAGQDPYAELSKKFAAHHENSRMSKFMRKFKRDKKRKDNEEADRKDVGDDAPSPEGDVTR